MNLERISSVHYTGDHWYNNTHFDNYIVELDGHDKPYKLTVRYSQLFFKLAIGDTISCTIAEDRLKNVKVLNEI